MSSIQIGFEIITKNTPTLPDAKRGAVTQPPISETDEQLKDGLVWWPCSFCNSHVLVDSQRRTREKCDCGAVRCHEKGAEGWRKGEEAWWFF